MIKGVAHAHLGPTWYHSEPLGVPVFPKLVTDHELFCCFLQQTVSKVSGFLG